MKIKTSKLTDAALDWAVLEALKPNLKDPKLAGIGTFGPLFGKGHKYPSLSSWKFDPSTNWFHGGPLIERFKIDLCWSPARISCMATRIENGAVCEETGDTPLIAAMRCLVASRLGEEVDIPEELL
jgi:hypothetical protein